MESDIELRYTLVQFSPVWENPEANLSKLDSLFLEIKNTDIIVLPEMFSTGFSMNTHLAEPFPGPASTWMLRKAKEKNSLVCGSIMCSDQGSFHNRFIIAFPDGSLSHYDKKHLFSLANEQDYYSAGKTSRLVVYKGWRIAGFVCYDLRFPEWLRNIQKGNSGVESRYDVLLLVASWPEKRKYAWNQLCIARAIENQSPLLAVNRCGQDGNNFNYAGESLVINAMGEVVHKTGSSETLVSGTLSKKEVIETRKQFRFLKDADFFTFE